MVRPAVFSIDSSRSTNDAPWRWASRRPTALLPLPGSPTRTTSMVWSGRLVVATGAGFVAACRPIPGRRTGDVVPRAARDAAPAGDRGRHGARDPLDVPVTIAANVVDRAAAERVEHRVGEGQHDHRLADDPGRRHDADVRSLVVGLVDCVAG